MSLSTNPAVDAYSSQAVSSYTPTQKTAEVKKSDEAAATAAAQNTKAEEAAGATVEISDAGKELAKKVTSMSEEDRAQMVQQLKADQESFQSRFIEMVEKLIGKQATTFGQSENIWKFLADGNYEVDEETQAQAKEAISEDGEYGVKKASERMFQFALALTGGDEEKMKEMQDAVAKGYEKAEKTWGKELPEISKQTLEATNKLFDDYLKSKSTETTAAETAQSAETQTVG